MGQQSLYRRYRPQTFGEVVGQSHVTRTLQNALAEQRLPHACLFSGPRGTGKTSTARILAKALNCERAPTREPCNVCTSCREITEGSSLDVVEIDAASHGSVDDARELREKVAYASVGGHWKVYILDECHMLTTAANNALLKVLEEPPPHVVFVFATTEPSKVLQTVLDRCQRYEFRSVDADAVSQRIMQVCEAEGVTIDGAAAALIAARTTGSVRDALGLLDQAVSYSGSTISSEDIARLFGSVPGEILFEAVDLISERDAGACFGFTDRLIRSGQEPREFLRALIDHLRSVFLVQHAGAAQEILDVADAQLDRLRAQANRFAPADLLRILDLAGEAHIQLRQAVDNRLALEIAFARMARPDLHASPAALLARVERLERASGIDPTELPSQPAHAAPMVAPRPPAPAPRPPAPAPRPPATPRGAPAPPRTGAAPGVVPGATPAAPAPAPAPAAAPAASAADAAPAPTPPEMDVWEGFSVAPVTPAAPPAPAPSAPAPSAPAPSAPAPSAPAPPASPAPDSTFAPADAAVPAAAADAAAVSPAPNVSPAAAVSPAATTAAAPGSVVDLDHIQRAWPTVLALVKKRKMTASAMLHEAVPIGYDGGELVLEFGPKQGWHRDKVSDPRSGYLSPLVEALFETFGIRPAIRCVLGQNEARSVGVPAPAAGAPTGQHGGADGPRSPAMSPGFAKDPIDLIREGFAAEIVEET